VDAIYICTLKGHYIFTLNICWICFIILWFHPFNLRFPIVSTATGYGAGWSGFDSQQGQEIFLYSTASRLALGPTQPSIQWVPWR
jgi:hypothetical protein